jgi:hypothetical protein
VSRYVAIYVSKRQAGSKQKKEAEYGDEHYLTRPLRSDSSMEPAKGPKSVGGLTGLRAELNTPFDDEERRNTGGDDPCTNG